MDEANIGHVIRHGVSPGEVQEIFANDPMDFSAEVVNGEERYSGVGHTNRLRVLIVRLDYAWSRNSSDNRL
jgi:uncharacterized DUF497 family protein